MPGKNATSPVYQDMEKKLATQFAKKPALYWIAIGKTDFLYKVNVEYRKLLDEKGYPYEERRDSARHCRGAQRVQAHTPAGTERKQQDTETDEPQVHPRMVSARRK